MSNNSTYVVLIHRDRRTPTVVSVHSLQYAEMIQTGMYTEHCEGTKRECQVEEENLLADTNGK